MRTIKQYLEAAKARKENGEEGFSLVELIVVVVILGILAAIAIPIFNGIQASARQSATDAAAANAVSEMAAAIAKGDTVSAAPAAKGDFSFVLVGAAPGKKVDDICITATHAGGETSTKGTRAGCAAPATP